jgi:hypothetical protein
MTGKVRRHDPSMCGVDLIALERARQIHGERWTKQHDDEHADDSLVLAAICYAAPRRIYVRDLFETGMSFEDPWPLSWDDKWDKRSVYGDASDEGLRIADPATYTHEERLDLLVKAGALIAAEIDRLKRAHVLEEQAP